MLNKSLFCFDSKHFLFHSLRHVVLVRIIYLRVTGKTNRLVSPFPSASLAGCAAVPGSLTLSACCKVCPIRCSLVTVGTFICLFTFKLTALTLAPEIEGFEEPGFPQQFRHVCVNVGDKDFISFPETR